MASGINNTFRIGGVALGVAALGALLENRIAESLASALGSSGRGLASMVGSAGTRPLLNHPSIAYPARSAFVGGLDDLLLICSLVLIVGAIGGYTLLREPRPAFETSTERAA
jgi:hypothetical protein